MTQNTATFSNQRPTWRKLWGASFVILGGLFISACGISLAGDVTPPPNLRPIATPAGQPLVDTSVVFPLVPPDPTQGAAIFQQKCLPCHGQAGMGDGPQASSLPRPVIPIGSAEVARQASPYDWFTIITQGNLQKFMPGFSSLNDRQRWDVVAYLYTLSSPPNQMEQGKAIYTDKCAACHGETGRGNGSKAVSGKLSVPDWGDRSRLVKYSAKKIFDVISKGAGAMPAYNAELSEEQRWILSAYVRSLAFAAPASPASGPQAAAPGAPQTATTPSVANPAQPVTPSAAPTVEAATNPAGKTLVSITGKVTHFAGKALPSGITVALWGFDGVHPSEMTSTGLNPDGTFLFKDVDLQPGWVYLARAKVNTIVFNSDVLQSNNVKTNTVDLPIKIYDTTNEIKGLSADRLHVFLDFSAPGFVQVMQLFIISNPGDRVVIPSAEDKPVLTYKLPQDAENLQFQDGDIGDRFIRTADGFGDMAEIFPGSGQHQVLFSYELPFNQQRQLTLESPIGIEAITVMMPPGDVHMDSSQLQDAGTRNMQGTTVQLYQASRLAAGAKIEMRFTSSQASILPGVSLDNTTLLLGGVGLGLVFILVGVMVYRRRVAPVLQDSETEGDEVEDEPEETSDSLMDAIIALDDQFQAGMLPEEAYLERRSELKARLTRSMGQKPT